MTRFQDKAFDFAQRKHAGQMYGDRLYTYHLNQVADLVYDMHNKDPLLDTLMAIAYLHDVAEDCNVSYEELVKEFGICIATSVIAISKVKGESKEQYLNKVLGNELARKVKICDTISNLMHSFLSGREKGMNKYPEQLMILQRGFV